MRPSPNGASAAPGGEKNAADDADELAKHDRPSLRRVLTNWLEKDIPDPSSIEGAPERRELQERIRDLENMIVDLSQRGIRLESVVMQFLEMEEEIEDQTKLKVKMMAERDALRASLARASFRAEKIHRSMVFNTSAAVTAEACVRAIRNSDKEFAQEIARRGYVRAVFDPNYRMVREASQMHGGVNPLEGLDFEEVFDPSNFDASSYDDDRTDLRIVEQILLEFGLEVAPGGRGERGKRTIQKCSGEREEKAQRMLAAMMGRTKEEV